MTSLSTSHFISKGTPGRLIVTPRSVSTMKAGAVPLGFFTTIAPLGICACRSLFFVSMKPRFWNLSRSSMRDSGSVSITRPVTAAIASRVRSSCVGPIPPPVITTSERSKARSRISVIRSRLSPTVVL